MDTLTVEASPDVPQEIIQAHAIAVAVAAERARVIDLAVRQARSTGACQEFERVMRVVFPGITDQEMIDSDRRDKHGYLDGYDREGYNYDGFDRDGYGREGYDRQGHDRDGYDRRGFKDGVHRDGWRRGDDTWRQAGAGYDANGLDPYGYNVHGYDRYGYNRDGYDQRGYDRGGYNRDGIHRDGGRNRDEMIAIGVYDHDGNGRRVGVRR